MTMNNKPNTMTPQQKANFSLAIQTDKYKNLVNSTLGDPQRARQFIAAISSAVATNPKLQECEAGSILASALLGEALNLSPSPQLGQYYLVPYKKTDKNGNVISITAQFQLGYKGYIQLAIRSGNYKKINVLAIKDGELVNYNPLEEEIIVNLIDDEETREKAKTIGYYAMFEYVNGFKKALYWSKEKMLQHADKYSQAFSKASLEKVESGKVKQEDMWKYSSYWYKDFDGMAFKTMLRQLISKWGVMSIEMQEAFEKDMAEIKPDGTFSYIDSDTSFITEIEEPKAENEAVKKVSIHELSNNTEQ